MHNTADHNNIVGIGNSCCRGYRLHLNTLGECWHCVYKHDKTTLHKVIIVIIKALNGKATTFPIMFAIKIPPECLLQIIRQECFARGIYLATL